MLSTLIAEETNMDNILVTMQLDKCAKNNVMSVKTYENLEMSSG